MVRIREKATTRRLHKSLAIDLVRSSLWRGVVVDHTGCVPYSHSEFDVGRKRCGILAGWDGPSRSIIYGTVFPSSVHRCPVVIIILIRAAQIVGLSRYMTLFRIIFSESVFQSFATKSTVF